MKIIHIILSCLFLLSACDAPSSQPDVESTSMQVPTSTLSDTATATAIPKITNTPDAQGFSPVLYGLNFGNPAFLLLGGVRGDVWLAPEIAVTRFSSPSEYDVYSPNAQFQVMGDAPELNPRCGVYFIGTNANLQGPGLVGVGKGWQITQRNVETLSSDNQLYQQVVSDWLAKAGISNPVIENLNILRVDIEGDGVDKVFISASHFKDESGHMTEAGDYSLVLMRKVLGNDVNTIDIVGDVYHSKESEMTFPFMYSLVSFMDLNQDGKLEVVIQIDRWEGLGAAIYQIDGQQVIQTLREFCAS